MQREDTAHTFVLLSTGSGLGLVAPVAHWTEETHFDDVIVRVIEVLVSWCFMCVGKDASGHFIEDVGNAEYSMWGIYLPDIHLLLHVTEQVFGQDFSLCYDDMASLGQSFWNLQPKQSQYFKSDYCGQLIKNDHPLRAAN
jgi:hypothetical protein